MRREIFVAAVIFGMLVGCAAQQTEPQKQEGANVVVLIQNAQRQAERLAPPGWKEKAENNIPDSAPMNSPEVQAYAELQRSLAFALSGAYNAAQEAGSQPRHFARAEYARIAKDWNFFMNTTIEAKQLAGQSWFDKLSIQIFGYPLWAYATGLFVSGVGTFLAWKFPLLVKYWRALLGAVQLFRTDAPNEIAEDLMNRFVPGTSKAQLASMIRSGIDANLRKHIGDGKLRKKIDADKKKLGLKAA